MAFATINKGSSYFNPVLYTGNGSTQSITGVGFKPDFVWIKSRSNTYTHLWYDIIRGAGKYLQSPSTGAEGGDSGDLLGSFNTDGFQVNNTLTGGTNPSTNGTSSTFVAWNWLGANTTVSNTSGTITSTVSANTTSGFSVVNWTGSTSSSAQTVGHGLGVTPKMIILKNRDSVDNWFVYHASVTNTSQNLYLNTTAALTTQGAALWGAGMTSTLVGVRPATFCATTNDDVIMYCFAEVKGFSKFGSYTGNGSTDGTFIYTGFKPAFIMVKASSTTGQWAICDNRRGTANTVNGEFLFAESNEATNSATNNWDFLSNGLKARANYAANNTSGVTYIYMAFAENPFVLTDGTPVTAR